jgi:hypothetical protein
MKQREGAVSASLQPPEYTGAFLNLRTYLLWTLYIKSPFQSRRTTVFARFIRDRILKYIYGVTELVLHRIDSLPGVSNMTLRLENKQNSPTAMRLSHLVMATIILLLSPLILTAAASDDYGEQIFERNLNDGEGVEIEHSITIEVVDTTEDIVDSAEFLISSPQVFPRTVKVFMGDTPTKYETYSGACIYLDDQGDI